MPACVDTLRCWVGVRGSDGTMLRQHTVLLPPQPHGDGSSPEKRPNPVEHLTGKRTSASPVARRFFHRQSMDKSCPSQLQSGGNPVDHLWLWRLQTRSQEILATRCWMAFRDSMWDPHSAPQGASITGVFRLLSHREGYPTQQSAGVPPTNTRSRCCWTFALTVKSVPGVSTSAFPVSHSSQFVGSLF